MSVDLLTILQVLGPAVGVYAAVRVDIAILRVRVDHLERKAYPEVKR